MLRVSSFLFSIVLVLTSCTKEKAVELVEDDCGEVSYSAQIAPLIQQSCATNLGPGTGCHDGWILEYENLEAPINNGTFWSAIETGYMPKIPNAFGIEELTLEEKELFRCWIKQGALNN